VCPAPCEASCTLTLDKAPVLIRHIELQIVERAWAEGWVVPQPNPDRTGKRVAVIGSGPAGLAAAQQLARSGHDVVVFEKDDRIGGLLRYGIPDFKLDKKIIDRRVEQLRAEGVQFQTGVAVGEDISARYLQSHFDAVVLTMGAGHPRDLTVEGRQLENVHFAMDYLKQQNKLNAGDKLDPKTIISAKDRVVVVIGGGDTGSDCVGTAIRQGAKEVHQFEILPKPPEAENPETPWPDFPRVLKTSSSQEEGCQRRWCVLTKKLVGKDNRVTELHGVEVEWTAGEKGWQMAEKAGSEFTMPADLVLLAMGFVHVTHSGLVEQFGLKLDNRGNVVTQDYMTSEPGIFAAGDTASGASLVVRGIDMGRKTAAAIDAWLRGGSK
jgi:NAD(P)H-dependent glutamate synthase small subunit